MEKERLKIVYVMVVFMSLLVFSSIGCGNESIRKGEIYKDPLDRFEVVCPTNEINIDNLGIAFSDAKNFSNYLVRAYGIPPLHPEKSLTIGNVLSDIQAMMVSPTFEIKVLRQEPTTFKGYEAMIFNFCLTYKNGSKLFYYSRLIRTENYIFWLYLSTIDSEDVVIITNENEVTKTSDIADKFFNGVNLLK